MIFVTTTITNFMRSTMCPGYMGLRMQAMVMANHYANVYDELH
jgi:hypothetical protein